jgi:integrase
MATIFKPKGSRKYVILYFDENGKRRKVTGSTDRVVSDRLARDLENRVLLRREGIITARDDARATHEAQPIARHLDEWLRGMVARGRTARHASQYRDRAGRLVAVIRGCPVADTDPGRSPAAQASAARRVAAALSSGRLSDLAPDTIQHALACLRDAGKTAQTCNHYRAAIRAFVHWCLDTGRLRDDPLRGVMGFNVGVDDRPARRCLSQVELAALVQAAEHGPERYGMPGRLRAMAYRLAAYTGLRVSELRSLTRESFRLDGGEPVVIVRASSAKNRKPAVQPIPGFLVGELRDWLEGLPHDVPVLPLRHETAKAIRDDLTRAGVPYRTDEGTVDFHALRSYYTSMLVRSGASISEVRALCRHAKPETTLKHYAKVALLDARRAVENLPALPTDVSGEGRTRGAG